MAAGAEAHLVNDPDVTGAEIAPTTSADDLGNFSDLKLSNFTMHLQSVLDGTMTPQQGKHITVPLPSTNLPQVAITKKGLAACTPVGSPTW